MPAFAYSLHVRDFLLGCAELELGRPRGSRASRASALARFRVQWLVRGSRFPYHHQRRNA